MAPSTDDTRLKIHHIDIGQGDATLIVLKKGDHASRTTDNILKAVLIDSGENINLGLRIVDYLKHVLRLSNAEEYKTLDAILCSHYDKDHIGGFAAIIPSKFCDENTKIYDRGLLVATSSSNPDQGKKRLNTGANNNGTANAIYGWHDGKSLLAEKRKKLNWKLFCNSDLYKNDTQNNLIILGELNIEIEKAQIDTFKNNVLACVENPAYPTEDKMRVRLAELAKEPVKGSINSDDVKEQLEKIQQAILNSLDFIFLNINSNDTKLEEEIEKKVKNAQQITATKPPPLLYSNQTDIDNKIVAIKDAIPTLRDKIKTCFERKSVGLDIDVVQRKIVIPKKKVKKNTAALPLSSVQCHYIEKKHDDKTLVGTKIIEPFKTNSSASTINITMTCIAANGYILNNKSKKTPTKNSKSGDMNNQMGLAFLIEYENFCYYTGGDIGQAQEEQISDYLQNTINKKLNAFKVSHHGSPHSTPDNLLNQLNSSCVAFISYGWDNTFLHPKDAIIKKLASKDIIIYFSSLLAKLKNLPSHSAGKKDPEKIEFDNIKTIVNLTALQTVLGGGKIGLDSSQNSTQKPRTAAPGTLLLTVSEDEAKQVLPLLPRLQVSYDRFFKESFTDITSEMDIESFVYSDKFYSELLWETIQPQKLPQKNKTVADRPSKKQATDNVSPFKQVLYKIGLLNDDNSSLSLEDIKAMDTDDHVKEFVKNSIVEFLTTAMKISKTEIAEKLTDEIILPTFTAILPINQAIKKERFTWKDKTQHIAKITDTITPS